MFSTKSTKTAGRRRIRAAALLGTTVLAVGLSAPAYAAKPDAPRGQAASHQTSGTSGTSGDVNSPQPKSRADRNGTGANHSGPYDSTRDGSPSMNGNGGGKSTGKPCAGCVGKADNKNPKGQYPGGSDHNAGYECDSNHGIGRGNPAHTGCTSTTPPTCEQYPTTPQDDCTEESTTPVVPPTKGGSTEGGSTEGGSTEGACEEDMSSGVENGTCAGETAPTSVQASGVEIIDVLAPSSTTVATSSESSKSQTERPAAMASGTSTGVLPQTGAGAMLLWAALAGMLLTVAGAASLVFSRIRARS